MSTLIKKNIKGFSYFNNAYVGETLTNSTQVPLISSEDKEVIEAAWIPKPESLPQRSGNKVLHDKRTLFPPLENETTISDLLKLIEKLTKRIEILESKECTCGTSSNTPISTPKPIKEKKIKLKKKKKFTIMDLAVEEFPDLDKIKEELQPSTPDILPKPEPEVPTRLQRPPKVPNTLWNHIQKFDITRQEYFIRCNYKGKLNKYLKAFKDKEIYISLDDVYDIKQYIDKAPIHKVWLNLYDFMIEWDRKVELGEHLPYTEKYQKMLLNKVRSEEIQITKAVNASVKNTKTHSKRSKPTGKAVQNNF